MKQITLSLCLLFVNLASGAEIQITLTNPPAEGTIVCLLYDSANTFGDLREAYYTRSFTVKASNQYRLEDIPAGTYALVVFQDENTNGFLDKSFIGFPREPIAISNGYRPKGPPVFQPAQFTLGSETQRTETMTLERVLGERGRFGVGFGVVGQSSPYRDYSGSIVQAFPTLVYVGERFQLVGPSLSVGILGSGKTRLAATLNYRLGAYEEDDSPYLQGMGDRRDTAMLGLGLQAELWGGLEAGLGYQHDILDQIGGGNAQVSLGKSFQLAKARLTPSVGLNWVSAKLANYDFGVSTQQAQTGRPFYEPGDSLNPVVQLGSTIELTRNWLIIGSLGAEFLDGDIRQSPIVSDDYVLQGFFAVNYLF